VNRTLTSSPGSWNGGPTSYSYRWQRCSSVGTNCVDIPGATTATYKPTPADLHDSVRSTVRATNVNGASPLVASAASAAVIDVPTAKKAPHIAGRPRVGKKVSASHGSWTYSPTGYRYQWLRCNARGGACIRISHATQAAYKLTKRDAKHRIRVRVTAANAAGSKTATSRATARVPAARAR
jgi:hypothetical protein